MSSYEHINKKLYQLNFAKQSRMDIRSIMALHKALDLRNYPMVHVAGTNGKGSCVKKLFRTLTLSGYKCASFTSPHIATFRERIQINGEKISKELTAIYAEEIFALAEKHGQEVTFFEVITLMALKYFADQKVDVAIIEVGLGGRLDATNCIMPILSIITSISFDHVHILGDTLEKIAAEKAGIIKKEVPILVGPNADQKIIEKIALENDAPLIKVQPSGFKSYDEENQAIAKKAIQFLRKDFQILDQNIEKALKEKLPCRFEKITFLDHNLILDMSHNEDGLSRLFMQLDYEYPNRKIVIFTSMAFNHNYHKNLELIMGASKEVFIIDIDHPRLASAQDLLDVVGDIGAICKVPDIAQKINEQAQDAVIVFTGSIFIMGDVYKMLGREIEHDEFAVCDGLFKPSSCQSKG